MDEQDRQPSVGPGLGQIAAVMRTVCQVFGLILVIVGLFFALNMLVRVGKVVDDPTVLEKPLGGMADRIEADKLTVKLPGGQLPLGKLTAMVLLMMWYALGIWIPLAIVFVGAKIVAIHADERAHVRMILSEFLDKVRKGET